MDTAAPHAPLPTPRTPARKVETQVLTAGGLGLLALAAWFLWRELEVPAEVLLLGASALAGGAALALQRLKVPLLGPVVLLGATATGSAWYLASREPLLLAGLGVLLAASVAQAVLATRQPFSAPERAAHRWHRVLAWHGVGLAFLATSLAAYFHLFDASELGLHGFIARRALLSLLWLAAGVGGVLWGRARGATEVRDAGFLVLAAGAVKLATFDAATLDGALRVGALAAGGALLLAAAAVVRRLQARAA